MGCDWCEDGNTPINGFHYIADPEDFEGTMKIPCQDQIEEQYAQELNEKVFAQQDELAYLDKQLFGGR